MKYASEKVPICNSVDELNGIMSENKDYKFCLYLAYKKDSDWDKSTSRMYMNQVVENLIYLPVNIEKEDYDSLEKVYDIAEESSQIVAINQTQPHKSNPVLKKRLNTDVVNVDTLIRNEEGSLIPFDLNGPSITGWFKDEVDSFENKIIVLLGVGGVGEPIARKINEENLKELILSDINSKDELVDELKKKNKVEFLTKITDKEYDGIIIFINCAGKEGADDSSAMELLEKYANKDYIFVDLRPHLNIDIVNKAKDLGWKAYTGYGMNARNDYTLLVKICELIKADPVSFDKFKKLVADAS